MECQTLKQNVILSIKITTVAINILISLAFSNIQCRYTLCVVLILTVGKYIHSDDSSMLGASLENAHKRLSSCGSTQILEYSQIKASKPHTELNQISDFSIIIFLFFICSKSNGVVCLLNVCVFVWCICSWACYCLFTVFHTLWLVFDDCN